MTQYGALIAVSTVSSVKKAAIPLPLNGWQK